MERILLSIMAIGLMLGNTPGMAVHCNGMAVHCNNTCHTMNPGRMHQRLQAQEAAYYRFLENLRAQCNRRFQQTIIIDGVTYNTNHTVSSNDALDDIGTAIRSNVPIQVPIIIQPADHPDLITRVTIMTFPALLNPLDTPTATLQQTLHTTLQGAVQQLHNASTKQDKDVEELFGDVKNAAKQT